MKPTFAIGYVAKAHGLHGELGVKTFDPTSEALFEVERLALSRDDGPLTEFSLEHARSTNNAVLVTVDGVSSRSAAEALVGSTVHVFREDLEPPEAGAFFQGDLVGLEVRTPQGEVVGRVESLWSSGPVPNLVIKKVDGGELMLPFAEDFIVSVELEQGRVTVNVPEES